MVRRSSGPRLKLLRTASLSSLGGETAAGYMFFWQLRDGRRGGASGGPEHVHRASTASLRAPAAGADGVSVSERETSKV